MTGGTESEGFEPETTGPSPHQQETGSTPQGVKRYRKQPAEPQVWAVQLLDKDDLDWYAIAAWCGGEVGVQAVGETGEFDAYIEIPGKGHAFEGAWIVREPGGFRIREDFVFAEVYEAATDPARNQVTVNREDLAAGLALVRSVISAGLRAEPVFARLSAAAEVTR